MPPTELLKIVEEAKKERDAHRQITRDYTLTCQEVVTDNLVVSVVLNDNSRGYSSKLLTTDTSWGCVRIVSHYKRDHNPEDGTFYDEPVYWDNVTMPEPSKFVLVLYGKLGQDPVPFIQRFKAFILQKFKDYETGLETRIKYAEDALLSHTKWEEENRQRQIKMTQQTKQLETFLKGRQF